MKKSTTLILAATVCLSIAGVAVAKGKKDAVLWPADELKWMAVPMPAGAPQPPEGTKPPMIAALWGDPMKGAHGAFVKFESSSNHPLHTHTNELKGVVLQGTFTIGHEGGEVKRLGPGSYFLVPGGWRHTSACEGACLLFQESPGKFDMKPAGEMMKK